MKVKLTRRNIMVGGAAVGALGLGAGVYGATATPFDYFKRMFEARLPGVSIPDADIRAFTENAMLGRNADFAPKLRALCVGVRILGWDGVQAMLRGNFALQKFERELLTLFLLQSNFFELSDPQTGVVEYYGHNTSCGNPFAQFAPPT